MSIDSPSVLICDPCANDGLALAARLRERGCEATIDVASVRECPAVCLERVDVAFVNVAGPSCDGLAFAADLAARCPWVEIVFWFREGGDFPGAAVARSLGLTRLIRSDHLEEWAESAVGSLLDMARARRLHINAEKTLPAIPSCDEIETTMRLPEAESRFREIYLRRILAESGSYAAAARRAGIPYTTFRSMLEKLGVARVTSD
jgi:hypothetical protein